MVTTASGSRTSIRRLTVLLLLALLIHAPLLADSDSEREEDLSDIDLEGLMSIRVTSVAGVAQPLRDTPAAIHVITAEDIRRGGHRSLADALRMVPGMNVGQIASNVWGISARGFNDRFSTKLLVLIDGRAVYNTMFSGVFWDVQDTLLADVDRIEVIRGPGATLWGANAVNGVINVVTKRARETQGGQATLGGGKEEQGFGSVRYGGKLAEDRYYRVFAKYDNRDAFRNTMDQDAGDAWDVLRLGFRIDFESNPDTTFTLQGDIYNADVGVPLLTATLTPPFASRAMLDASARGGNLLARVEHLKSPDAGWTLQAYADRAERLRPGFFDEERDTLDVEFRQHFKIGRNHSLIWGAGFRHRADDTRGSFSFAFDPTEDELSKYSAFVQDTIRLADGRWAMMVGSKYEHNEFTDSEVQPGMRLAWIPSDRRTAWASVARAVRTPSRGATSLQLVTGVALPPDVPEPSPIRLVGNTRVDSEELIAYEAGYRCRPFERLTLDAAAFYNDYDRLISVGAPTANPLEVTFANATTGESYGLEATARWDASARARLAASYSMVQVHLDGLDEADEETSPRHQFNVRSYFDVNEKLQVNAAGYFVGDVDEGNISSYTRLDVGLAFRPSPGIQLSVWGQNLLEHSHPEFTDPLFIVEPIDVERSVYAQLRVEF